MSLQRLINATLIVFFVFFTAVLFVKKDHDTLPAPKPSSSQSTLSGTANNGSTTATTYTTSQVATHNNRNDCWLIVSGKVYDVTQFLPIHPGGSFEITPLCGQDATVAFDTQGGRGSHSSTADALLAEYLIGKLQ